MKSVIAEGQGGYGKMKLIETPTPTPTPSQDQVRVRAKSAGVGIWDEMYLGGEIPSLHPKFPVVPGWEGAGIVSAIGSSVENFKVGDEVIFFDYPEEAFSGAWAEEIVVPERCVGRKPSSLSMEEAGGLPGIALTPYQVLKNDFSIQPGQSILICNGAGGVGTCAIQLAHLMGAEVIGLSSASSHPLLKSLGAHWVFDYHQDFTKSVKEKFPAGVDCVFDNVGDRGTVSKAIQCLKSGGKFISIVDRFEDLERSDVDNSFSEVHPNGKELEELGKLVEQKKLRIVIDEVYPIDRFEDAMKKVSYHHVHGKVVLRVA